MDSSFPKCEVCFFPQSTTKSTLPFIIVTTFITCKGCSKVAHRFCYLPECEDKEFMCDACQYKPKKHECCVCGNDGLLKRSEEGDYGHPVCLAMCKLGIVKSYKNLSFNYFPNKKNKKKGACSVCKKETQIIELVECFDKNCSEMAHLYCVIKDQWRDDEEGNRWVQDLKIFDGDNINFISHFEEKVKKVIKNISNNGYKTLYGDKKIREENPICIIYCGNHCQNLTNCYCASIEEEEDKDLFDWVFCDSCGKWYHFNCENFKETKDDKYKCKCCKNWHKKIEINKEPVLKDYPKLHFYDFVYLQYYAEKKNYRLPASLNSIIKKVPVHVSEKYFNNITKSKEMITKVLNSINFITIKNKLDIKTHSKSNSLKKNERMDRIFNDVIWKMNFLISNESLKELICVKKYEYGLEEIIEILKKFNNKFSYSNTLIKQIIKILTNKLKIECESDDDDDYDDHHSNKKVNRKKENFDFEVLKATSIVKSQIEELKKINTHNFEQIVETYYTSLSTNELLKSLTKDYNEEKSPYYELSEPILLYETKEEMSCHLWLNQNYGRFVILEKEYTNLTKIQNYANIFENIYNNCTNKVKYNNILLLREIHSRGFGSEFENFNNVNSAMVQEKNETYTLSSCFYQHGIKYTSEWMFSIEENIKNQLRNIWLNNFIKSLQIKESSLTYLCNEYPRIDCLMTNLSSNKRFRSYLKFYESAKTFYQTNTEIIKEEEYKFDFDLLENIRMTNIDKNNITKFCNLFVSLNLVNFTHLNENVEIVIREKSEELLNYIEKKGQTFECELEFKTVEFVIEKLKLSNKRLENMICKNKELICMLKEVTLEELNKLEYVETHLNILNEAKEFCIQNHLQFRINKIKHMIKLFECKIEAFKYLPEKYVVKFIENLPVKFRNVCNKKCLDFYTVKKLYNKIKMLKLPNNDHLYESVNQLIINKIEYINTLTSIISTYNINLEEESTIKLPKYNKAQIMNMMKENSTDYITCKPEEEEIMNIIEIYNNLKIRLSEISKKKPFNEKLFIEIYHKIDMLPFEFEEKIEFGNIFSEMCEQNKKYEITENSIENNYNKKTELDETSAKMECSNPSLGLITLIEEIKSKPRVFSYDEIDMKIKKILKETNVQNSDLDEILACYKNVSVETDLISKLKTGERLSEENMILIKKMLKDYEKQFIRIEDIESIENQIKIIEKVPTINSKRRSKVIKQSDVSCNSYASFSVSISDSASVSGSSLASNRSTRNDEEELKEVGSKNKKRNKYFLNK